MQVTALGLLARHYVRPRLRQIAPRNYAKRAGTTLTTLTGHDSAVLAVAFTTIDGVPVAVTGSDDQSVRVWDPRAGTRKHRPRQGIGARRARIVRYGYAAVEWSAGLPATGARSRVRGRAGERAGRLDRDAVPAHDLKPMHG